MVNCVCLIPLGNKKWIWYRGADLVYDFGESIFSASFFS